MLSPPCTMLQRDQIHEQFHWCLNIVVSSIMYNGLVAATLVIIHVLYMCTRAKNSPGKMGAIMILCQPINTALIRIWRAVHKTD